MSETAALTCVRCGRETAPLPTVPMPGPTGTEVQEKICPACWAEWQRAEVMVINELRLNFMDPRSIEVLNHHMREFLLLDGAAEAGEDGANPVAADDFIEKKPEDKPEGTEGS